MYRKAYKKLTEWKDSAIRKPLLLLGARQVGKMEQDWLINIPLYEIPYRF